MITISNTYNLIWFLKDSPHYKFTQCGKCFNVLRGKEIKRTLIGYTQGFCINGKFKSLKKLRSNLIKIENVTCPF